MLRPRLPRRLRPAPQHRSMILHRHDFMKTSHGDCSLERRRLQPPVIIFPLSCREHRRVGVPRRRGVLNDQAEPDQVNPRPSDRSVDQVVGLQFVALLMTALAIMRSPEGSDTLKRIGTIPLGTGP